MQYVHPYAIREEYVNHTGPIFGLIFLALLITGIIIIVRMILNSDKFARTGTGTNNEPIDIARERYAKGEITKEELAEIKVELLKK